LEPSGVRARDRLVTGDGPFEVLECRSCRYGVTEPQLRGAELARYYGSDYFEEFYGHDGAAPSGLLERARARFRRTAAARRFERAPFAISGRPAGRVLDVGCGGGELLAHYAAHGWQALGIDPSATAAAAARRRGIEVHVGTLADQPWEHESFDLVVFSHSLEHIPEPLEELRAARQMLAPAGQIAIAAPNWRCWQRWLFRGYWFPLDLPRHLQHFSPRALSVAARSLALEPVEIGTSSTVISLAYSIHYLLARRWTPGWKLWLAYALGLAALPAALVINGLAGGDACYAVLRRTEAAGAEATL
jgi:2-polyprenyl-3-methyl-5-hydroxy-6-metoxy-1,4-benzoquinol methylase